MTPEELTDTFILSLLPEYLTLQIKSDGWKAIVAKNKALIEYKSTSPSKYLILAYDGVLPRAVTLEVLIKLINSVKCRSEGDFTFETT